MTRYEAWPITAAILVLALAALVRKGERLSTAAISCARLAAYPAMAIVLFILNSRWTTGSWFVTGGFFVAENEALGRPLLAWEQIRLGLYQLSGRATVWPAYAGALAIATAFVFSRASASLILVLAPAASRATAAASGSRDTPCCHSSINSSLIRPLR